MKISLAFIALTLLAGCTTRMLNEQIIAESQKCEGAGLPWRQVYNYDGSVAEVICTTHLSKEVQPSVQVQVAPATAPAPAPVQAPAPVAVPVPVPVAVPTQIQAQAPAVIYQQPYYQQPYYGGYYRSW